MLMVIRSIKLPLLVLSLVVLVQGCDSDSTAREVGPDGIKATVPSTPANPDESETTADAEVAVADELPGQTTFQTESVSTIGYTENEWLPFSANLVVNLNDADEEIELSKYGGWKQHQREATGFFRTEKIGDRWWAVDPEGYLYIHKAVNSVNLNNLTADEIHELLIVNGFNGIGNWSDEELLESPLQAETPLAYTPKFSFIAEYRRDREPRIEMPVFDDEFVAFAQEKAQYFEKYVNDPNVFGYFSDNELSWTVNGLSAHLAIENPLDKNYIAAINFLQNRGKTAANYDDIDVDEYTELMAEAYFAAVVPAIRAVDPNHMYLGTRLNRSWRRTEGFIRIAGQYMDILALNHYHRWGTRDVEINNIAQWSGRPVLVSEFYAMESDDPENDEGAGWRVDNQTSRGAFYHNYVSAMVKNRNTVGWHWFKFQDDSNGDKGIVAEDGSIYGELLQTMCDLNIPMYQYISHIDSLEGPDLVLSAQADAYFKADTNYGADPELRVKNGSANFYREAYLRFDVSSVSTSPESAIIKLYSIAEDKEAGSYQAELVVDNNWDEMSINTDNNPEGSRVLGAWSHADDIEIDVTDVIRDNLASDAKISIRVISTLNNGSIPVYGAREHPVEWARPRLFVHYE